MRKLITWFTKFSKIVAIVEYIYKGILIAVDVVNMIKKEILDIKPDFHYTEALEKTVDYLTKAAEAVALVLSWIGGDVAAVAEAARKEVEASAEAKAKSKVDDLVGVTGELDKLVQANK